MTQVYSRYYCKRLNSVADSIFLLDKLVVKDSRILPEALALDPEAVADYLKNCGRWAQNGPLSGHL